MRRGAHDDAVAALRRARDELDELKKRVRGADAEAAGAARARLQELREEIDEHAPEETVAGRAATERELVVGANVIVPKLGGRGVVVALPERGRVTVQIGTVRATAAIEDVRMDDRPPNRAERRAAAATGATPAGVRRRASTAPVLSAPTEASPEELAPARTADATCDLRGERVDDALGRLDRYVDESLRAAREVIFVIHGHGTGALKAAVREQLDGHPGVSRWRAGQEKEGGDGVTVVWLDV
jgi:DNA mismatch repair protein MutS2